MIKDYFSLSAWHNFGDNEFWLVRLRVDWYRYDPNPRVDEDPGWYSIDVGLLGLCASLTFWPRGKRQPESVIGGVAEWEIVDGGIYIADGVSDLKAYPRAMTAEEVAKYVPGREHGEAGE